MKKQNFSTTDLMKAVDVSRERYKNWLKDGNISPPSIREAGGTGKPAILSRVDVYLVGLVKRWSEVGIPIATAGAQVRSLFKRFNRMPFLVEDGGMYDMFDWFAIPRIKSGPGDVTFGKVGFGKTGKAALESLEKRLDGKEVEDIFLLNFKNLRVKIDKRLDEILLNK